MDLIVSRGRLIVKEIGFVDLMVSRGRLIVKEIGFVDLPPSLPPPSLSPIDFNFYLSKYLSFYLLASLYSSFDAE